MMMMNACIRSAVSYAHVGKCVFTVFWAYTQINNFSLYFVLLLAVVTVQIFTFGWDFNPICLNIPSTPRKINSINGCSVHIYISLDWAGGMGFSVVRNADRRWQNCTAGKMVRLSYSRWIEWFVCLCASVFTRRMDCDLATTRPSPVVLVFFSSAVRHTHTHAYGAASRHSAAAWTFALVWNDSFALRECVHQKLKPTRQNI